MGKTCKNPTTNETIKLGSVISEDDNTKVYSGDYNGKSVIVKLCKDKLTSSELENKYYDYLESLGIGLPKHYRNFYIDKYPVLVLDKIDTIKGDSGIAIGLGILRQLKILHQNGMIWGSGKPNNVMKHKDGRYTIIDLGSVSIVNEGACRKSFCTGYTTQEMKGKCVVIYPWNDLYELGKVIVAFEMRRKDKEFSRYKLDKYGYLDKYFDYLKQRVNKTEFNLNEQVYADLENILISI
jgi:serine/threonine protein kinase